MSDNLRNAFPITVRETPYNLNTTLNRNVGNSMIIFPENTMGDLFGNIITPDNLSTATTFNFRMNWLTNGGMGQVNWFFNHLYYDVGENPLSGSRETDYTLPQSTVANQILVTTTQQLTLYPDVANSTFLIRRNGQQASDTAPDAYLHSFWFEYEVNG